ncbi:O-succinylbenzoic acid--CoA ligase [Homoserinimonas aerilata]|uniref:O-succinylbenzoic acid--CoA ligase n=1 Tax=Homoserinimonas aerilata TaxID=1162970 RepID=A0A542YA81_9MICO|nr:AMP-binding protein [Homoserinimonas aerilata]TQL44987.1 O-succinylbenzoic acid--CoA ligase [Homoserinimonas aerilata]
MTRELRVVDGDDAPAVLAALREALAGGPAVMPLAAAQLGGDAPAMVEQTVEQRVALVVQTSGTTGHSKRVALSADALLAGAAASESALGGPGQWLLALPAHYIAGINVLTRSITAGTEPVMVGGRFEPHAFARAALAMDAPLRFTSLVPAQLAALLDAAEGSGDLSGSEGGVGLLELLRRFDRILVGGQSTPPSLLARAIEEGLNVTRTYGSSETAGGCVYDGEAIGTVGVQIVDGLVELSGPVLAEGYLGDPARTDAAFVLRDGIRWYRTGDLGEFDGGVLRVTGRADDVIVSGGLKVSLAAVERVVRGLPGQTDAVAVSAGHERWGEVPVVVTTTPIGLEELRAAVGAAEGNAARPDRVVVLPSLPLLPSGKPDRRAIAELARD